jgi:hypothetical protein
VHWAPSASRPGEGDAAGLLQACCADALAARRAGDAAALNAATASVEFMGALLHEDEAHAHHDAAVATAAHAGSASVAPSMLDAVRSAEAKARGTRACARGGAAAVDVNRPLAAARKAVLDL